MMKEQIYINTHALFEVIKFKDTLIGNVPTVTNRMRIKNQVVSSLKPTTLVLLYSINYLVFGKAHVSTKRR